MRALHSLPSWAGSEVAAVCARRIGDGPMPALLSNPASRTGGTAHLHNRPLKEAACNLRNLGQRCARCFVSACLGDLRNALFCLSVWTCQAALFWPHS